MDCWGSSIAKTLDSSPWRAPVSRPDPAPLRSDLALDLPGVSEMAECRPQHACPFRMPHSTVPESGTRLQLRQAGRPNCSGKEPHQPTRPRVWAGRVPVPAPVSCWGCGAVRIVELDSRRPPHEPMACPKRSCSNRRCCRRENRLPHAYSVRLVSL
jgi:hypothetical protein